MKTECACFSKVACRAWFPIDGREVGIYFVDKGDYCGELCIFDNGVNPEHVIALNSSSVVFVPTNLLRDIATRHPIIMEKLGKKLASRVRQMTKQRALLALPNIPQRVCNQLWMLIKDLGEQKTSNLELENSPTLWKWPSCSTLVEKP